MKTGGRSCHLFEESPRECRQAGILNLGSEWLLSFRIRHVRRRARTTAGSWSATDANQHWFKEYMALTNTAGNTGRATPGSSKIQLLLGGQYGIKPRSHGLDSTLRFRRSKPFFTGGGRFR